MRNISCTTLVLFPLVIVQSVIISFLLIHKHPEVLHLTPQQKDIDFYITSPDLETSAESITLDEVRHETKATTIATNTNPTNATNVERTYEGVAATLMINSPKWFQRRYTVMISNILHNTPKDWAVQIFYVSTGQSQFGIDINKGLQRLIKTYEERIIMTEIPKEIYEPKGMRRKLLYWTDPWLWEQMVADSVLVFSGNGALCGNSKISLVDGSAMEQLLDSVDYVGSPWGQLWGVGGDGAISFRRRNAMLEAIRHTKHDGNTQEDRYFIDTLLKMNNERGEDVYRIASKEQTEIFGGTKNYTEESGPPVRMMYQLLCYPLH